MIRILAAAGAGLFLTTLAASAAAQTWGQPIYVSPYGRIVGGTPLSEVETRSYVHTGRWADGYSDQVYVYVPAPVYGQRYGHERSYGYGDRHGYGYGRDRYDRRHRHYPGCGHGHGYGGHEPRPRPGYRDVWGYNDDRHPSARGWRDHRRRPYGRDCDCPDVYLYDR